jgi:hypothetical protein
LPLIVSDEGRSIELSYHAVAVTPQPADDDLDSYEAWAHDRLTPVLGPLRRIDRRGGPPALHDFEADLADGSVAALEVTGEVDAQPGELRRLLDELEASGRRNAYNIGDYHDPFVVRLGALGIE